MRIALFTSVAAAIVAGLAPPAAAPQITPTFAIGDSGRFDDSFPADAIVRQTGAIHRAVLDRVFRLGPRGRAPSFITLDPGGADGLGDSRLRRRRFTLA